MKQWIHSVIAMSFIILLAGCDRQGNFSEQAGLEKLAKGISSESDVRIAMGQPETVWEEENGSRTLEYPKGPMGHRTWMFAIDKDGKLKDYRQVLSEENFANIKPGMSQDTVRRLLGKPRTSVRFKLKNEEVWDWRYLKSHSESRFFNVHFDIDSRLVTRTSSSDDQPNNR